MSDHDVTIGDEHTRWGGEVRLEPESVGSRIGERYEIEEIAGRGGMGVVYRCRDLRLNREVAVKRLLAFEKSGVEGIERFRREARAVAALNHRNIVTVHEFHEDDTGPFLVMELVEGRDLGEHVEDEGPLEGDALIDAARQVASALSYAHRRGVVHRDLKPSNLIRQKDGTVKVLDFGLARIGTESQLSRAGFGMGTLDYVSPEQRRDATAIDHRSDLFSLGATVYFLATGNSPRRVREKDLPEHLRPVVWKLMADRPEERFFSADELLNALDDAKSTGALGGRPTGPKDGCAACGAANAPDARYCERCGVGLYDDCPACGAEGRAGRQFCTSCGVNIPNHAAVEEMSTRAARHEEAREWRRAAKLWRECKELRPRWPEPDAGMARCKEATEKADALLAEGERLLEARDLESLARHVSQIEGAVPVADERLQALREGIADVRDRRDAAEALVATARSELEALDLEAAERALDEASELWPGLEEAEEVGGRLRAVQEKRERLVEAAANARETMSLAVLRDCVRSLGELVRPGDPAYTEAADALADLEDLEVVAASHVTRAESALASAELERASAAVAEALEVWPGHPRAEAVSERIEVVRVELPERLERAAVAADSRDVESLRDALSRAREMVPAAGDELARLEARLGDLERTRATAGECVLRAAGLLADDELEPAGEALEQALALWPEHPEALEVQIELAARVRSCALEALEGAVAAGDIDVAQERLLRARAVLGHEDEDVLRLAAELAEMEERRERAIEVIGLAETALSAGDLTTAQRQAEKADELWPQNEPARLVLVEVRRARARLSLEGAKKALAEGRLLEAERMAEQAENLLEQTVPAITEIRQGVKAAREKRQALRVAIATPVLVGAIFAGIWYAVSSSDLSSARAAIERARRTPLDAEAPAWLETARGTLEEMRCFPTFGLQEERSEVLTALEEAEFHCTRERFMVPVRGASSPALAVAAVVDAAARDGWEPHAAEVLGVLEQYLSEPEHIEDASALPVLVGDAGEPWCLHGHGLSEAAEALVETVETASLDDPAFEDLLVRVAKEARRRLSESEIIRPVSAMSLAQAAAVLSSARSGDELVDAVARGAGRLLDDESTTLGLAALHVDDYVNEKFPRHDVADRDAAGVADSRAGLEHALDVLRPECRATVLDALVPHVHAARLAVAEQQLREAARSASGAAELVDAARTRLRWSQIEDWQSGIARSGARAMTELPPELCAVLGAAEEVSCTMPRLPGREDYRKRSTDSWAEVSKIVRRVEEGAERNALEEMLRTAGSAARARCSQMAIDGGASLALLREVRFTRRQLGDSKDSDGMASLAAAITAAADEAMEGSSKTMERAIASRDLDALAVALESARAATAEDVSASVKSRHDEMLRRCVARHAEVLGTVRSMLLDLDSWTRASESLQNQAARFVERRLGEELRFDRLLDVPREISARHVAVFVHERTRAEFVLVPAGSIRVATADSPAPASKRVVQVTSPFLIARTEVSWKTWVSVSPVPREAAASRGKASSDTPARWITWTEATEWCRAAGLELPTSAQWEWAARGGISTSWPDGDDEWVHCGDERRSNAPLRTVHKKANGLGLYGALGNVLEWSADVDGQSRRALGGAWSFPASEVRYTSAEVVSTPDYRSRYAGLRPLLEVKVK